MASDLARRAIEEVRRLHAFFVGWFRGEAEASAAFHDCEEAFDAGFRMVTPDGAIHARAAVLERLRSLRATAPASFSIEILEPRIVWQSGDAVLLEFVEQQYRDGMMVSRRSTGLFLPGRAAPLGVVWRHLQETWLEPGKR